MGEGKEGRLGRSGVRNSAIVAIDIDGRGKGIDGELGKERGVSHTDAPRKKRREQQGRGRSTMLERLEWVTVAMVFG
ncbi:hypothetical protein GOBAR_DD06833 [Gossypium barbadense]|nr:hypothetical protein GOBAR_DD06833 [Gossypium barbadense]